MVRDSRDCQDNRVFEVSYVWVKLTGVNVFGEGSGNEPSIRFISLADLTKAKSLPVIRALSALSILLV